MYFLRGSLPWQGIPGKNKDERYKKILQKKMDTSAEELCEGFPKEFEQYIEYTRGMEYEEEPDYDKLREYFMNVLEKKNEVFDYIYVWSTEEEKKLRKKEYLEEKNIRRRKLTSKTNSITFLQTKIENISNIQHTNTNTINDELTKRRSSKKETNKNNFNNKNNEEDNNKVKQRNSENKINYKFATKENSIEDAKNKNQKMVNSPAKNKNQKMVNSPVMENGRKNNRARTHNIKRKNSRAENNNELKRENEEICCTEACVIF